MKAFEERKERNRDRKRIDNSDLYVGSPMYYYCNACGDEMRLSESHLCPVPTFCIACDVLKEAGVLAQLI